MLYIHLKFVNDQAVARLKKDWSGDNRAYDLGDDHILKMADMLAEGIVKQFQNHFRQ
ncbi:MULTISPECIES: hypothetical protein [Fictibacillus]|uniref:Uncharacterized protein n=1 Tax=Fictibacillus terranigra TaxID=3058424 RepID=A0ABT8E820_9BACL|nr:hypothetical protein [Fictibacillus sp. CENA-BCM004]MDN4074028.1 hypothetical protein [Fictibacillus sp. CENA-BCM004]